MNRSPLEGKTFDFSYDEKREEFVELGKYDPEKEFEDIRTPREKKLAKFKEAERRPIEIAVEALNSITRDSASNKSARVYFDFEMVTLMADGFPLVRFTLNKEGSTIYVAFLSEWRDNNKLQYSANPNSMHFLVPVDNIKEEFKKVKY